MKAEIHATEVPVYDLLTSTLEDFIEADVDLPPIHNSKFENYYTKLSAILNVTEI